MRKLCMLCCAVILVCTISQNLKAQVKTGTKSLKELQQEFVDLKFGMFIHFNIGTSVNEEWPDPDTPARVFNPIKLNCNQWAEAAKSAKMSYGCLTAKHHSGFCIWDTKTTDYNVMNSLVKRDVVKEYVDAFRKNGLKTMLYYSILDTRHKIRPGFINREKVEMIKVQLTELLTNYGEVSALIIDGWDAPWSRISYEDVPFEEIYRLIKRLQPNCLVMDLNSAKYPADGLFYTDIKSYEQNSGQSISKDLNHLPAMSCLPIQSHWFWKKSFLTDQLKSADFLVNDNIIPLNKAYCNFMLNVSPNPDGLIDDNALKALEEIGEIWDAKDVNAKLLDFDAPIISTNVAKYKPANSSWSRGTHIMDFGTDDNFRESWQSSPEVKEPWYEIDLEKFQPFSMITIADSKKSIKSYRLLYKEADEWKTIFSGENNNKVKVHRFNTVWGEKVKVIIDGYSDAPEINEIGVYNEQKVTVNCVNE